MANAKDVVLAWTLDVESVGVTPVISDSTALASAATEEYGRRDCVVVNAPRVYARANTVIRLYFSCQYCTSPSTV